MARRRSQFLPTLVSATQNVFSPDGALIATEMSFGEGAVDGYIKWDVPGQSEYCVANEYICSELARLLRLPVPPATIAFFDEKIRKPVFFALDINNARSKFPPVHGDIVAKKLPDLAAGIVLFDIWVANGDRNRTNLAADSVGDPKEIVVYDHGQALFGGIRGDSLARFAALHGKLGLRDDQFSQNCLIDHLSSFAVLSAWFERIEGIDNWLIRDILDVACSMTSIPDDERERAESFLTHRKNHISTLVRGNRDQFSGITDWPKEWQRKLL